MRGTKSRRVSPVVGLAGLLCFEPHGFAHASGDLNDGAAEVQNEVSPLVESEEHAESVAVVVQSNRPVFLYQMRAGSVQPPTWFAVCTRQPCAAAVSPREQYFVGGPHIVSSAPFRLPVYLAPVTLDVKAASREQRTAGVILLPLGMLQAAGFVVTGILAAVSVVGDGLCHVLDSNNHDPCPTSAATRNFGYTALGLGVGAVVFLGLGGMLYKANKATQVTATIRLGHSVSLTSKIRLLELKAANTMQDAQDPKFEPARAL